MLYLYKEHWTACTCITTCIVHIHVHCTYFITLTHHHDSRIAIANADLALARGDTEQALALLKTITDDKPYYIQAVEKMAQIYHRNR